VFFVFKKPFADHTKLTGAGGGGCLFTLLNDATSEQEQKALIEKIEALGMRCFKVEVGGQGIAFE
jgi:mevalonate kinase